MNSVKGKVGLLHKLNDLSCYVQVLVGPTQEFLFSMFREFLLLKISLFVLIQYILIYTNTKLLQRPPHVLNDGFAHDLFLIFSIVLKIHITGPLLLFVFYARILWKSANVSKTSR